MAEAEELDVYVVPMQKRGILLPGDTIAEIIPYEPLQRIEESPEWFLGLLSWRGIQVPVASFEMMTVERASFSLVSVASACLIIVRGMSNPESLPYYALVAQTTAVAHTISSEMLFETGETLALTESARVRFHNDVLSIPNLDYLEVLLLSEMIQ